MYAIPSTGAVLAGRYDTADETIEAAQEILALAADTDWQIVQRSPTGEWVAW